MWTSFSHNENLISDMFNVALALEEPWKLTHIEYDEQDEAWSLFIDFERGALFPCPNCGTACKAYDTEKKMWRHLDFWNWKTYLHARVPRTDCKNCNKVTLVPVKWSRPKSHFTLQFDAWAMRLMAEMPVNAAARELREHDTRMWRIFHHYVDQAMAEVDLTSVSRIAIDETSSRRGHRYITLFVDVDTKTVLFATEGKGKDTLARFNQHLHDKGAETAQIQEICCDMSVAFIRGIEEQFPTAEITFDKFHVMKMVNEAVDDVRKAEQKENPELKRTKYLWLKNETNLKAEQKEQLNNLTRSNLKTGRAYRLKLALQDLWTTPHLLADVYLRAWLGWARRSQLEPMIDLANTVKNHEEGILRWFHSKMTNGLLEGINGLVQAAKRKARGYRNVHNLIAMVYMTANKLRLPALGARRV
ncbi:ISL3 family transposase [Paenibacillus herberti]|uniref:ISL3 family transposase n=1 Tax=Paenibacillus herberti TaxID=1619309 RepID=A0A229NWY4_9BACL|nr:ISL3 family transposase [Paenibacillus herberti]OXM13454.1 ISL3 family transposase [Paenibacillus herberti]OXM14442.1 ISL3 family transposase [Paenibacillus herberti]OXM14454.1 ISL3 family transposase [Paenibacillus herberti]